MSFLTDPAKYPFRPGALFLGLDDQNREVGISTERHAITIAGSGSGKGAAVLIPNAIRWPDNLLVVDPKGEAASASWEAREALGQTVHVIDPFNEANVPPRLRASFNPLQAIDPESVTAREDIEVIADGLVKRSDPKHEEWYEGAVSVLAGLIGFVIDTAPPELRNLAAVRSILLQSSESLYADAQAMLNTTAFGGLAKEAGITLMTAIEAEKGMEKDFLGAVRRYTKWMDSPQIAAVLAASSFALSTLKTGDVSIFLVLPPKYISTHAAFLRLFVRTAINAMMQDGATVQRRCLFMLDEFYSLGRLDAVSNGMGLMRGYGLHLWPFLQDLGQLQTLYGEKLSSTFFANADAAIFFGNSDPLTLEEISRRVGVITLEDLNAPPPAKTTYVSQELAAQAHSPVHAPRPLSAPMLARKSSGNAVLAGGAGLLNMLNTASYHEQIEQQGRLQGLVAHLREMEAIHDANAMREYQHTIARKGERRFPPETVAALVGKNEGDVVAAGMLVFAKAGDVLNLQPWPYFKEKPLPLPTPEEQAKLEAEKREERAKALEIWKNNRINQIAESVGRRLNALRIYGSAAAFGLGVWRGWSSYTVESKTAFLFENTAGKAAILGTVWFLAGALIVLVCVKLLEKGEGRRIGQQVIREARAEGRL